MARITEWDLRGLSARLKRQMNDIIDVAYRNKNPSVRGQLKRFTISCSTKETRSFLGDCRHLKDGSSQIRIMAMEKEGYREILITTMHEVSHHIDYSLRGHSGHDAPFYLAHKKLLFAAFDMGILSKADVIHSKSRARNRNKLAKMMDEYVPHPVNYKQGNILVSVFNGYSVKDALKARGYRWNPIDEAWTQELTSSELPAEQQTLAALGVSDDNIRIVEGSAVVAHLRNCVRLYNVPFEHNQTVKSLGFRWRAEDKHTKYWEKKFDGESLPAAEMKILNKIPNIKIITS